MYNAQRETNCSQMHNSHQKNSKLEQKAKASQCTPMLLFQQNEQEEKNHCG